MILSEITSPGDKIDIRLMHQVKIEDNGGYIKAVSVIIWKTIFWKSVCLLQREEWFFFR